MKHFISHPYGVYSFIHMACKKGSSLNRTQIMAATSSESVENIGKPDGDENSFTVGRVRCQHQLFFGQRSSVYYGFWKEDGKTLLSVLPVANLRFKRFTNVNYDARHLSKLM